MIRFVVRCRKDGSSLSPRDGSTSLSCGKSWRLCYYLQHFRSPARVLCVAVLLCCWGGVEKVRGDCATVYSTSPVPLPWCVCCVAGVEGVARSDCATIYSTSAVRLPWCGAVLLCCREEKYVVGGECATIYSTSAVRLPSSVCYGAMLV